MIKERVKIIKEMMELPDNPCKDTLNPQQRNWLYMILKSLHDTRYDRTFDKKDMEMLDSIFVTLSLHYDSTDEESK